jgi:hypothetical protein
LDNTNENNNNNNTTEANVLQPQCLNLRETPAQVQNWMSGTKEKEVIAAGNPTTFGTAIVGCGAYHHGTIVNRQSAMNDPTGFENH